MNLRMKFSDKLVKSKSKVNRIIKFTKPAEIAFSISMGIFIGIFVPYGLQTFAVIPFAFYKRSNGFLVWSATYISNPFTILPIYFCSINVGSFITGSSFPWNRLNNIFTNPSVNKIMSLGSDSLMLILLGSFIIAVVLSILTYFTVYFSLNVFKPAMVEQ